MDEYKIYPKSGFGHVDFNNLAAIFYDLDLAKDFVSYQISLGADYALYFKGEEIEDFQNVFLTHCEASGRFLNQKAQISTIIYKKIQYEANPRA